jgi:hypothetical protein
MMDLAHISPYLPVCAKEGYFSAIGAHQGGLSLAVDHRLHLEQNQSPCILFSASRSPLPDGRVDLDELLSDTPTLVLL